jgi:hypothetical protein
VTRCERIVDWIVDAIDASDVFIADGGGLPIAGAVRDDDARLASAAVVASAIGELARATPGSTSPLFELHVGEGPFFQLIGLEAASTMFFVGFTRATPLTYRQAHAVRLACRHALLHVDAGPASTREPAAPGAKP